MELDFGFQTVFSTKFAGFKNSLQRVSCLNKFPELLLFWDTNSWVHFDLTACLYGFLQNIFIKFHLQAKVELQFQLTGYLVLLFLIDFFKSSSQSSPWQLPMSYTQKNLMGKIDQYG